MSKINGASACFDHDLQDNQSCLIPAKLLLKFSVATPNAYVLKSSIATINSIDSRFAVALSNNFVKVYDKHGNLSDEYKHDSSVSCMKFSDTNPDILFTSSSKGKIHVWDLRSKLCVQTFYDDSDGPLKPILCFDFNNHEEIICGGTELQREDAFHLFWDRRSSKILGGYWNSHAGDITQIQFHPNHSFWMASSSVDGLINIFDLNETSEDDALMQTINVEAPVNTFIWKSDDILSCTTSNEEFNLMEIKTAQSILNMSREKFFQDFKIKTHCMIDSLPIMDNFFLATGKNSGEVHLWNIYENSLNPETHNSVKYFLKGHTDVVRTISYKDSTDILLTGGDDGCVCLWKLKPEGENLERLPNGFASL